MKNLLKIPFALTILSVAMVGCSSTSKVEKPKPSSLPKIEATQSLARVFESSVSSIPKNDVLHFQVDRYQGLIYTVSPNGEIQAYEGNKKIWEKRPVKELSTGISVDAGVAVVGTRKGQLIAVDAKTGETLWQQQLTGALLSPSLIQNNRVITVANDGAVTAHDAASGQMLWTFNLPATQLSVRGYAAPTLIDERTIAVTSANAYVYALDVVTGVVRWQRRVAVSEGRGDLQRLVDIDGRPIIVNSKMITVSYQGQVTVVDLATQKVVWSESASSLNSPASNGQNVFIAESNGRVVAYDLYTGQKTWENDQLLHRGLSNPVILDNQLVVGDFAGHLHILNPITGELIGRAKTSGDIRNLRVEDNLLYVATSKGNFSVWQNR